MAYVNKLVWLLGGHDTHANILVVGLQNCGKSTIMQHIKPNEVKMVHPAPVLPVGPPCESFKTRSLTFTAFDIGELSGFGNPWEDSYRECHGIVFIIDSSDRYMIPIVQEQLWKFLDHPSIANKHVPILFLAHKSDQQGAMPGLQLASEIGLNRIKTKPWTIISSSSITGDGFNEGFDWFAHQLRRTRRNSNPVF